MYFSIRIESTNPRVANIVDCASLEDVNSFLTKYISFTKPRNWMDELDNDLTQIEDKDMRHNELVRHDIIKGMMRPDCNEIHIIDGCFVLGSSPCKLQIKKVKHCGKEGEHMYIDNSIYEKALKYCETDVKSMSNIYRTFQVTPERVIYNDPATIVFWKDGTKTVVKCMEGDTYNPEVGLAMCVCKKLYDSKYHKFFRYYAPKEPVAKAAKKTEEEQMDEIYDKIHEMVKDVLKTDKSFLEKFASQLFGKEENIK